MSVKGFSKYTLGVIYYSFRMLLLSHLSVTDILSWKDTGLSLVVIAVINLVFVLHVLQGYAFLALACYMLLARIVVVSGLTVLSRMSTGPEAATYSILFPF
jgi:hypothetical protein